MPKIQTLLKLFANKAGAGDAQLLIAAAINGDRAFVVAHPEYKLSAVQAAKAFFYYLKFRLGYPLAYITGHREFCGLDFLVNRHTLVPRPETELIVEEAADTIKRTDFENNILLIDVGTGSGCIPIAIAKSLQQDNVKILATDISRGALRVARKNAKKYRVDIEFRHGNLLEPVYPVFVTPYSFVVITANLPYLTAKQYFSEPSIKREPKNALIADDKDGLSLYKKLFEQFLDLSSLIRCPSVILIEIDPRQSRAAMEMAQKYFQNSKLQIKKDLAGLDRVLAVEQA